MTRTDIHRPSAIVPADYDFISYDYIGPTDLGDWAYMNEMRRARREHMARTGGTYSGHEHGGSCHVCGAHALYTATFWHRPTNKYVRTGLECADAMDHDSGAGERFRRAVHERGEAQRGLRKAKDIIFTKFNAEQANRIWGIFNAPYANLQTANGNLPYEENALRDIVGKLVRYGSISDNAAAYLGSLLTKIDNRAQQQAERAAAVAAALPVPTGKITVQGKVLTIKEQEGAFGPVVKMLVQHNDGWKVWGTVPSALEVQRGFVVQFNATVTASPDDAKFGFYKRPTKAKIIQTTEAA